MHTLKSLLSRITFLIVTSIVISFLFACNGETTTKEDALQNKLVEIKIMADRAAAVGFNSQNILTQQLEHVCSRWYKSKYFPLRGEVVIIYIYSKEIGKSGIIVISNDEELKSFKNLSHARIEKDTTKVIWSSKKYKKSNGKKNTEGQTISAQTK